MSSNVNNRLSIMEVIYSFNLGGSEQLSVAIAKILRERGFPVSVCSLAGSDGVIRQQLEENHIPCFSAGMGQLSRLRFQYALYKIFRKEKPDVIHVHHAPMLIQAYLPARLAGIKKIVLTEHSNHHTKNESRLKKLSRFFSKRADVVTTIHDGLREFFINDFGVPAENVVTIPNGIDVDKFSPIAEIDKVLDASEVNNKKFVISCIGRLVPEKDHENLLNAIKQMVDGGVFDFEVQIIGDGPRFDAVRDCIDKLNISSYVKMLGARNDILELLRESDVVVLSSKTEGLPMVLLEAMCVGVPCIATAVGGIPHLLGSEVGVVVPPENSELLAKAIKNTYENRTLLNTMGQQSRQRIINDYDIHRVVDSYISIFNGRDI